ncbi:hypothetical protein EON82_20870 [bacterium]|nr:MAG: hypothetical protein EON82_20870 [bacterium]
MDANPQLLAKHRSFLDRHQAVVGRYPDFFERLMALTAAGEIPSGLASSYSRSHAMVILGRPGPNSVRELVNDGALPNAADAGRRPKYLTKDLAKVWDGLRRGSGLDRGPRVTPANRHRLALERGYMQAEEAANYLGVGRVEFDGLLVQRQIRNVTRFPGYFSHEEIERYVRKVEGVRVTLLIEESVDGTASTEEALALDNGYVLPLADPQWRLSPDRIPLTSGKQSHTGLLKESCRVLLRPNDGRYPPADVRGYRRRQPEYVKD